LIANHTAKTDSSVRACLFGILIIIGLAITPASASALGAPDAVANKTLVPPVMDGRADDATWLAAQALTLATIENEEHPVPPASVTVTMKFAYDSKYVYVLAQWPDASWSVYKHAWAFDAATHKWTTPKADEDRFAIMWDHPLFPVKDFLPLSGCKGVCHSSNKAPSGSEVATANESFLSTNAANEKMDLWHWKAARTAAAGWADDQGLDYNFSGKLEAARPADAKKTGGPADNKQKLNNLSIPKYYEPIALTPNDAAFILKAEVDSGEALSIHWVDDAGALYYMADGQNKTVPEGAIIPGYVLSRSDGSRGEVDAADTWASGTWTLEMRRALDTTDPNDVAFKEGGTYAFAVGVFNNSGGRDHVRSTPRTVEFTAPPLPVSTTPATSTPVTSTPASSTPVSSSPVSSTPPAESPGPGLVLALVALGVGAITLTRRHK